MFRIIWPTIRPQVMRETYAHWVANADRLKDVTVKIAVNTEQERTFLPEFNDVLVVGDDRRGPCHAVHKLCMALEPDPGDVVILASDDFYPKPGWDTWVLEHLKDFDGALMVNDGVQTRPMLTIPIMTQKCFLALNRVLNHPSYNCCRADVELHSNLAEMDLVKSLRHLPVMFEHRHYSNGKRWKDANDEYALKMWPDDVAIHRRRMTMPLADRLNPAIP